DIVFNGLRASSRSLSSIFVYLGRVLAVRRRFQRGFEGYSVSVPIRAGWFLRPERRRYLSMAVFWHQHQAVECLDARLPQSNQSYWLPKLARNVSRDAENVSKLEADGWRTLVIWECETKDTRQLASRLKHFLR